MSMGSGPANRGYASSSTSSSSSSAPSSSTAGSGVFLEELQSTGLGFQPFHTNDPPSRVVSALSDGGPKDVAQIMSDSGCLPLATLLDALRALENFGLVVRSGNVGREVFQLSESGRRTSQMMGLAK
jgi:hypothetical protein